MSHFLLSPQNSRHVAVAYAPSNVLPYFALMAEMINCLNIPFDFTLNRISFGKSGSVTSNDISELKHPWSDYQPNSFAWPLMSHKLRDIIDLYSSQEEQYEWLPVNIKSATNDSRTYYVLRFNRAHDVLDLEHSDFQRFPNKPDQLVKPVFSHKKIAQLCVFGCDEMFWRIPTGIYVSQEVRNAAKREGLVGLHFENARAV